MIFYEFLEVFRIALFLVLPKNAFLYFQGALSQSLKSSLLSFVSRFWTFFLDFVSGTITKTFPGILKKLYKTNKVLQKRWQWNTAQGETQPNYATAKEAK